jgi:NAD-dependent DNA ligase
MSQASAVNSLVEILRRASHAYYNGGSTEDGLLGDDMYDAAVDRLRELDPTNPFLEEVGAPPPVEGAVRLPHPMPSLDKIKPGQDQLGRFLTAPAAASAGFVLTEKLDGLSALWLPAGQKLFLRGDGLIGQDISHLVALGLGGLVKKGGPSVAVRGEILLPRSAGEALARAWVNGVIHRKAPAPADVAKLRFVAYEVVSPKGMRRSEQMAWLAAAGYEVPWVRNVRVGEQLTEAALIEALQTRRRDGVYDTDGIVVGWDTAPQSESTALKAKNPKDCVAFKMPLADQSAETTVCEVLWATSAQGYMIPRLQFDPVKIGAATITFCTGHNARAIVEGRLGPGARVVIRRSGDVIPTLDRVVSGAPGGPALPSGGWEWSCAAGADPATAVHIRAVGAETDAQVATRLHYFLKTLEIPGAGPSTATSLVGGGIRGPHSLWEATPARLAELLGPKTGASLHANLRAILGAATELQIMLASSRMPRGVGETKLRAVLAVEADPRRWLGLGASAPPTGWTASSFAAFLAEWPAYEAWRAAELPFLPYPALGGGSSSGGAQAAPVAAAKPHPNAQTICCTGFRDKDMEARAIALGHTIATGMTGKVTVLVVPEGAIPSSEKVKAAQAKGIPILSRDKFVATYLK